MQVAAPQTMPLPRVIDLDGMEVVRDWLIEAIVKGNVQLVGQDVERCATNSLLMLVAAAQTARKNGHKLTICHPSPAFNEAVSRLGMDQIYSDLIEG